MNHIDGKTMVSVAFKAAMAFLYVMVCRRLCPFMAICKAGKNFVKKGMEDNEYRKANRI